MLTWDVIVGSKGEDYLRCCAGQEFLTHCILSLHLYTRTAPELKMIRRAAIVINGGRKEGEGALIHNNSF